MVPSDQRNVTPDSREVACSEFDSTGEQHLASLLSASTQLIAEGSPLSLRLAGMSLLDYHQALLREAAHLRNLDVARIGDLAQLVNLLRTRVPGMDKTSWTHLSKLRNTIYHNEFRYPNANDLTAVLLSAPKLRKYVLEATRASLENERVMSRMVQQLLATSLEMRRELSNGSAESGAPWIPKIERALELSKTSPTQLTEEGAELLLELTKGVEHSRTYDALMREQEGNYPTPDDDDGFDGYSDEPDQPEPDDFDPGEYYSDEREEEPNPTAADDDPGHEDTSEGASENGTAENQNSPDD